MVPWLWDWMGGRLGSRQETDYCFPFTTLWLTSEVCGETWVVSPVPRTLLPHMLLLCAQKLGQLSGEEGWYLPQQWHLGQWATQAVPTSGYLCPCLYRDFSRAPLSSIPQPAPGQQACSCWHCWQEAWWSTLLEWKALSSRPSPCQIGSCRVKSGPFWGMDVPSRAECLSWTQGQPGWPPRLGESFS